MKKSTRKIIMLALALILAVSLCAVGYELIQYQRGDEAYSEAESLANLPAMPSAVPSETPEPAEDAADAPPPAPYVDPYADALRNMDFTALQEVNSEVLGWILIPDTAISYPIVQGADNDYYLKHTWNGASSSVGAIFMDYRCTSDLSGFNTIIYGHRMNNGSMFAGLKEYKSASYFASRPVVYITTAQGSFSYEIFAVYEGSPTGESYRTGLRTEAGKQEFLDEAIGQSLYDTGVVPTADDYVLTLSTCTGNGHTKRLIVHAVRRGYAASDTAQEAVPPQETAEPTTAEEEPIAEITETIVDPPAETEISTFGAA